MANKYLTKIAKNKFEKYLASQHPDRLYSNEKVQRAHNLVHHSDSVARQGLGLAALGAPPSVVQDKYLDYSRRILQAHRGNVLSNGGKVQGPKGKLKPVGGAKVMSPFQNSGDSLLRPRTYPYESLRPVATKTESTSAKILAAAKKSPVKTGLKVVGGVAAAGLVGYGLKKSIED